MAVKTFCLSLHGQNAKGLLCSLRDSGVFMYAKTLNF
jgi:hypothetical protein